MIISMGAMDDGTSPYGGTYPSYKISFDNKTTINARIVFTIICGECVHVCKQNKYKNKASSL